jgi:hypothetical protein
VLYHRHTGRKAALREVFVASPNMEVEVDDTV